MSDEVKIDFETYYANGHQINDFGATGYANHADTDVYLVSIVGGGFDFCGNPSDFNWKQLNGLNLVSHNTAFDEVVAKAAITRGLIDPFTPNSWHCSMNLMAYHGYAQDLKDGAEAALGITVDKMMRQVMSGRSWEWAVEKGRAQELRDYCRNDTITCGKLWDKFSPTWPDHEKELSLHTRKLQERGVDVDLDKLAEYKAIAANEVDKAKKGIPWSEDADEVIDSIRKVKEHCAATNEIPPSSMAKTNDIFIQWAEPRRAKHKWIQSLLDFRTASNVYSKLCAMEARYFNGRLPVTLKYFGAHTGRFSGTGGLNLQNWHRGILWEKVDLRSLLIPRPGNVFVTVDLAQIEPRCLSWLVEDTAMLEKLEQGQHIYEVAARRYLGFKGKNLKAEEPDKYQLAKAQTLSLGYGCSPKKFKGMAQNVAGLDLSFDKAASSVAQWREANPSVVAFWESLEGMAYEAMCDVMITNPGDTTFSCGQQVERCAFMFENEGVAEMGGRPAEAADIDLEFSLPTGRIMNWGTPRVAENNSWQMLSEVVKGKPLRKIWRGLLAENITQALAREVFCEQILQIENAGLEIVLHVHDEIVVEVAEADAQDALQTMVNIMSTSPEFAPDLPLAAEGGIFNCYGK